MKKRCLSCKREIAQAQQQCFVCGAQQSYFRYYLKTGIAFVLVIIAMSALSYHYIDKATKQAELYKTKAAEIQTAAASEQIQQVELLLKQTEDKLEQVKADASQANQLLIETKSKLEEAEAKFTKTESRASWLSKENARFKAQIKKLEGSINTSTQSAPSGSSSPQNSSNSQLDSLKQELANFATQKQNLFNQIAQKKAQLEASWRQSTGDTPPSAEVVAQRAQQVNQAIASEQNQILSLNNQIESTRKKIQDIEALKS